MVLADILFKKYKKVLLIDDDQITNSINKMMLQHSRFAETIVAHRSVDSAIDYLNSCYRENELPDIIFLDIDMPEKSGWEFIDELKQLSFTKGIKIFMLTSSIARHDESRANSTEEIAAFISKPLSPHLLQDIRSEYLEAV